MRNLFPQKKRPGGRAWNLPSRPWLAHLSVRDFRLWNFRHPSPIRFRRGVGGEPGGAWGFWISLRSQRSVWTCCWNSFWFAWWCLLLWSISVCCNLRCFPRIPNEDRSLILMGACRVRLAIGFRGFVRFLGLRNGRLGINCLGEFGQLLIC